MALQMVQNLKNEMFRNGSWKNTLIAGLGTALILTLSVVAWLLIADRSNFNEKICDLQASLQNLVEKIEKRDIQFYDKLNDTTRRLDFAYWLMTLDHKGRQPYLFGYPDRYKMPGKSGDAERRHDDKH